MKTAIYVEDGVTQIVLTPVTAFEREVLGRISRDEVVHVRVANGRFRRDLQGWHRFTACDGPNGGGSVEQCLMLRLGEEGETAAPHAAGADGYHGEGLIRDVPLQADGASRDAFRPREF